MIQHLSRDVSLGNEIEIDGGHITYNDIVDLKAESSDPQYNEKSLLEVLKDEVSYQGAHPSIDMPIPNAIVMFSEL